MQTFVYKARGADGSSQSGEILAASEAEALGQLRRRRLSGVSVRPKPRSLELSFRKGASTKDLVVFTRQFATMISAGLPLVQSLDTLSAQQSKPKVADKIRAVLREVQSGATLADAMRRQRDFFGDIYVSMVAAGEVGGVLDTILARLADYLEDTARLKRKVRSAMVYPVTIFAFAIVPPLASSTEPNSREMHSPSSSTSWSGFAVGSASATISFAGDYTIRLAGRIPLATALTIDGSGRAVTISGDTDNDGTPNAQLFAIPATGAVTATGLRLERGFGSDGGVVHITGGHLTLRDSVLANNRAGASGGAIMQEGGSLVVADTAFISNTAAATLSSYRIDGNGDLTLAEAVAAATGPGSAPIDSALSRNSRFLYVVDSTLGRVLIYRVAGAGLVPLGSVTGLPTSVQGIAAQ